MTGPSDRPSSANPHDALFRSTFTNVEHAAAELRSVLPKDLVAGLNLSSLAVVSGSYVDEHFVSCQSDLLFSVEVRGAPAFLYLLFEHQSSVDELMPFRILKYVVRILDRHVGTTGGGARALPLPLVVPLVIHHSLAGWSAATRMEDLFEPNLVADLGLRGHVPRLAFFLDDISHLGDEELRTRALGFLPTLTLWALRDARRPGRIRSSLERWTSVMRDLSRLDSGAEALATIFRYLSVVVDDLPPHVVSSALSLAAPEAKDSLMTTLAERWKAEAFAEGLARGVEQGLARGVEQGLARGVEQGLARGVEQGLAEGLARGQATGARQVLRRQLELKFGALSEELCVRLEAASEAELERWAGRVLSADSIAEVMSV